MWKAAWLLEFVVTIGTAYADNERMPFPAAYKTGFTNYLNLDRV